MGRSTGRGGLGPGSMSAKAGAAPEPSITAAKRAFMIRISYYSFVVNLLKLKMPRVKLQAALWHGGEARAENRQAMNN